LQVQLIHNYADIEKHIDAYCADDAERLYSLMTLSYGRHESQTLVAWCDETIATLNKLAEENTLPR